MYGQKPVMPIEDVIPTWNVLPWKDDISKEDLLALRIRQLERRPEDIEIAKARLKDARLKNKERFDRKHRLRPKPIEEGDWVLMYDSSLDNQHSTIRKLSKRWFGPYVVKHVHGNATFSLAELDGSDMQIPIAGKRIKLFKKREDRDPFDSQECQDESLDDNVGSEDDEEENNVPENDEDEGDIQISIDLNEED